MKCHYEVLQISQEAEDLEIKSAYRKLALKWHPDKNLDNPDYAKEQFQVVQQAYEVLSDRQERAWYDRHRDQILHGSNSEFEDNSLDAFQYFTTSCFEKYDDNENGFYTVYRNVFDKIAKEDMEYMKKQEFCEIPKFGNSESDYDDIVGPFYDHWMSYSTKKSYVWLHPYDIKETRDRRVLKLIEKENKKVRQKARKERNEEIRNLVAYVRKRDRRVQSHLQLLKDKVLQNRQKQQVLRKQKKLETKQMNESGPQPEWAKFDNVKSELEEIERHLAEQFGEEFSNSLNEESDISDDGNNLYCAACNKIFKTVNAFENHESSKKHKENVEKIKSILLDEEEEMQDLVLDSEANGNDESSSVIGIEETTRQKKKNKKNKTVLTVEVHADVDVSLEDKSNIEEERDLFDFNSSTKSKKKNKRSAKKSIEINNSIYQNEIMENDFENTNMKTNRKNKKDKKKEIVTHDVFIDNCCVTCKANFESKNKLFEHLKKTNHVVALPSKNNIKQKNSM